MVQLICKAWQWFVEIKVTHPVDEDKLEKIKKHGVNTIEIDLNKLKEQYTYEEAEYEILKNLKNREILFQQKDKSKTSIGETAALFAGGIVLLSLVRRIFKRKRTLGSH